MDIKYKNKHKKDCGAIEAYKKGRWLSAWAYPELTWDRSIGWIKFICNDTQCKAEAWIENNEFCALIPPFKESK